MMRSQCGMFYSLYREYELKILRVSVKLAYLGSYFTERDLQYCWDGNILVVFPTLGPNAAKIIDYIERCFEQKLPCKNSVEKDLYLPQEWSQGAPNICRVLELKSWFFLGLEPSKVIDCIEKCFKQKLYKIKFPTKNLMVVFVYLPEEWS